MRAYGTKSTLAILCWKVPRADAERAQAKIRREQGEPAPDLLTQFGVQDDAATDYTVANVQIGIELPICDRNQGNISVADAEIQRATANVQRLELLLRERFNVAYRRYSMARNQVELYRRNVLPKAERNLKLTNDAGAAKSTSFASSPRDKRCLKRE